MWAHFIGKHWTRYDTEASSNTLHFKPTKNERREETVKKKSSLRTDRVCQTEANRNWWKDRLTERRRGWQADRKVIGIKQADRKIHTLADSEPTIGCGTLSWGTEPYHGVRNPTMGCGTLSRGGNTTIGGGTLQWGAEPYHGARNPIMGCSTLS